MDLANLIASPVNTVFSHKVSSLFFWFSSATFLENCCGISSNRQDNIPESVSDLVGDKLFRLFFFVSTLPVPVLFFFTNKKRYLRITYQGKIRIRKKPKVLAGS
jgi:hypothetical protein